MATRRNWIDEPNDPSPRYIAIEGPIGAGKSDMAEKLGAFLGYKVMREPVSQRENPLLRKFYDDPVKYGFSMQVQMLSMRLEMERSGASQVLTGEIDGVVLDRTTDGDTVFAKLNMELGNIDPDEYVAYLRAFEVMKMIRPYPDLMLYLDVSVPVLQDRIAMRGREFEQALVKDSTYLDGLEEAYTAFVQAMSGFTHVITIPWDKFGDIRDLWPSILRQYKADKHSRFEKTLLRH